MTPPDHITPNFPFGLNNNNNNNSLVTPNYHFFFNSTTNQTTSFHHQHTQYYMQHEHQLKVDNDGGSSYDLGKKNKVGSGLKLSLWKREQKLVSSEIKKLDQEKKKNSTNNACIKLKLGDEKQQPIQTDYSSNNIPIRVCTDCNTTKTPLWRSGPKGPKSLCNACGIRQRKARRAMAAAAAEGKTDQKVQQHKKNITDEVFILLCLCLFPIAVFSSTFTSQNLIDLPSASPIPKPVLDSNGNELNPSSSYRIISTSWGGLGGDVYLGKSPRSAALCPDGVFRYNSDVGTIGTPVRFIPLSGGIFEDQLMNIQFNIATVKLCVSYTIWKAGNLNAYYRAMLLETGGTIGRVDSSYFKIVKSSIFGYNLLYCPITRPVLCPFCRDDNFCAKVGVINQDGRRRLALVNENPLDVYFKEV